MWFVAAVPGLALVTIAAWLVFGAAPALPPALTHAVAVPIVACRCAIGLVTPTSTMVGTGRGAALCILFRQAAALQALEGVRVVAFDKTGTLTEGCAVLTDLVPAPGATRAGVLAAVAAVEDRSVHAVARAIVAAAPCLGRPDPSRHPIPPRAGAVHPCVTHRLWRFCGETSVAIVRFAPARRMLRCHAHPAKPAHDHD